MTAPDPNARPAAVDALRETLEQSVEFSWNYATAKPDIGETEKMHILGLCYSLKRAINALAAPAGPAAVDALRQILDDARAAGYMVDTSVPLDVLEQAVAALAAHHGPSTAAVDALRAVEAEIRHFASVADDDALTVSNAPAAMRHWAAELRVVSDALAAPTGPAAVDEAKLRETLAWANDTQSLCCTCGPGECIGPWTLECKLREAQASDAGREEAKAEQDARQYGTGFTVDGTRVHPERIRIFIRSAIEGDARAMPDR